ncbi:hypothetical protein SUGI_0877740 [Cryptomeria japonica]|nr:hypothetical protein SUGI_0877740 [Cryptomeria japonica]
MCAETVKLSYVPLINWSDSSPDFVSLLHAANEGQNDYYASYRFRGSRNYLARQAFLRSYKFSIEESFKDKLRRSVRRLNEECFEELLKDSPSRKTFCFTKCSEPLLFLKKLSSEYSSKFVIVFRRDL